MDSHHFSYIVHDWLASLCTTKESKKALSSRVMIFGNAQRVIILETFPTFLPVIQIDASTNDCIRTICRLNIDQG